MPRFTTKIAVILTLAVSAGVPAYAENKPPTDAVAKKIYEQVTPSLVVVQYTLDTELGRRELVFPGVVVSDDGLVMLPLAATSEQFPDSQMKDFKVVVPNMNGDAPEIDAVFQGRDERSNIAFVKTKEPQKWKSVKFQKADLNIGDTVYSVGLMPKSAGYRSYYMQGSVSSILRGDYKQILIESGGLTACGSPVFNADGAAIGYVNYQAPFPLLLNDKNPLVSLINAPLFVTPTDEFEAGLTETPTPDHPVKIPWSGIAELSGLQKDIAEYFNLANQPAVQIGAVVPGTPADKAGLKEKEIIIKVDGQPLERGDDPDDFPLILRRRLTHKHPGDSVTFTVLTAKDQPPKEVKLTLEERPKQSNLATRIWNDDLGFGVREMVFTDAFQLHLKPDIKGLLVTIVKPEGAAATGHLRMNDLVTQLNGKPVTALDGFKSAYDAFRKAQPHDAVVMVVMREGREETIRVEPPQ